MLRIKLEGLDRAMRMFDERIVGKAASQAINETVRGVRTAANKEIRAEWNVKASDLNQKLRAIKMAKYGDLEGIVEARSASFSLSYFGATAFRGTMKQTRTTGQRLKRASSKSGVYVRIKKEGGVTRLPHSFLASVAAGKGAGSHVGVFNRVGRKRLPIYERKVITVASMFGQQPVQDAAAKTVDEIFPRRFSHHIDRLLSK
jgi:hypothetical protein